MLFIIKTSPQQMKLVSVTMTPSLFVFPLLISSVTLTAAFVNTTNFPLAVVF